MKRGDFVVYQSKLGDREYGIITSLDGENVFVRYLRTKSNSESTPKKWLTKLHDAESFLIAIENEGIKIK